MYFILFLFVMIIFDGDFVSSTLQQESEATKAGIFNRNQRQTFIGRAPIAILMPEGGPWGEEKHWTFCPQNTWAIDHHGSAVQRIRSYDGLWGGWSESTFCSGPQNYLQSVQFKIESDQRGRDDAAANYSRFTCTSGKTIQASNGAPWSDWRSWAECPQSTAICEFAIKFEPDVRGGDDTALNGARFACCSTK
ncbi:unnamed protein product [Rotaria sp. Silwood2]|nr:unnamed protein product [Rotaria sp. Silwood2]CAF4165657.1 unnamed protein product [Rotaria sp. Silwood2]CAF4196452.1 unnamed protein product [Rotaria sp. Silwood2]